MVRTVFAGSLLILVAATAGCRMCASPYDDCGPTSTGACDGECCSNARQGSILSPAAQPTQYEMQPTQYEMGATPAIEPTPAAQADFGTVEPSPDRTPSVEEPVRRLDVALWNPLAGSSPQ